MNIQEIREKLNYYKDTLYSATRFEQLTDQDFYDDTFQVPWIKPPLIVSRTGSAAEMIDAPVSQLSGSTIKVYRQPAKSTNAAIEASGRIASWGNSQMELLMKQNPNPKNEFFKNECLRGEAWVHALHASSWVSDSPDRTGFPVIFLFPDPMIIFASPNEDEEGIPEDLFVYYERLPNAIHALYPAWTNPKNAGTRNKPTSTWMAYWSKKERYFEADGMPVLSDYTNPYGFVPFVHKVASFGKSSAEGKMEELIVGRLRKYRDLLRREAASTSDIDSIIHMFANPSLDAQGDDNHAVPVDFEQKYSFKAGKMNVLPPGINVKKGIDLTPKPEVFTWAYKIASDLGRKIPGALLGIPTGDSGRLQDMTYGTAMGAYGIEIDNLKNALATAFGMSHPYLSQSLI